MQTADYMRFMVGFSRFGHTSSAIAEGRSDTGLSPGLQSAPLAHGLGWRSYKAEYHKLDTHLLRPLAAPLPAELPLTLDENEPKVNSLFRYFSDNVLSRVARNHFRVETQG